MKTCRHCLSEDIPDGAKICKHCGRKLALSAAPTVIKVIALVSIPFIILALVQVAWLGPSLARASAIEQAHQLITSENIWCSPDTSSDAFDVFDSQMHGEISKLDLGEDRPILDAAYTNRLEQLGCGPWARHTREAAARARLIRATLSDQAAARSAAKAAEAAKIVLSFVTQPDECNIYIDQEQVGISPVQVTVSPGDHTYVVAKGGYTQEWDNISVEAGERKTINVSLKSVLAEADPAEKAGWRK